MSESSEDTITPASAPVNAGGKVRVVVADHVEQVTRFGNADFHEVQPEQEIALILELTLSQEVTFEISRSKGAGRLQHDTDKFCGATAMDSALFERLDTARSEAGEAISNWAARDGVSYRRLMSVHAPFLHASVAAGYEHTCHNCDGACKVRCTACAGRGESDCHSCQGTGKISCHSCHGSKHISCSYCNGRGSWSESVSDSHWDSNSSTTVYTTRHETTYCGYCSSSGKTTCHSCDWSGKINCYGCAGQGKINCIPCAASGKVNCIACAASGIEHVKGHIVACVHKDESLAIDSSDQALVALVRENIPLGDLPSHGALLKLMHHADADSVTTRFQLRLDVRLAQLCAADKQFDIYGFGPLPTIINFGNIAGHMLGEDLQALEAHLQQLSRWRLTRNTGLLAATASFLRSELNMLIAEKVADAKTKPESATAAVEQHFRGMVEADYVERSTAALRCALGRVYADELLEPGIYLCALAALAAGIMAVCEWPVGSAALIGMLTLGTAACAWLVLEWGARRRIACQFATELAMRVCAQLQENGSVKRWRIGIGAGAALAVTLAISGVLLLPAVRAMHTEKREMANAKGDIERWYLQSANDWQQRQYPSRTMLEREAGTGNWRAQLLIGWQLLLGAGGGTKDVAQAGAWLDKAATNASSTLLWKAAKAIQALHEEATPAQVRAASTSLKQAADNGFVEARYWEARTYLDPRSPVHDGARGVKALAQAADKNHAHAALMLGQRFVEEPGGKHNKQRARHYLQIAAQGGLAKANEALAVLK